MMYNVESIMYLWFVPVCAIIVFPLLILLPVSAYNALMSMGKIIIKEENGKYSEPIENFQFAMDEEQRKCARVKVDGMTAHIPNGTSFCTGSICEISRDGIRLAGLSHDLEQNNDQREALVTGHGKAFKMKVKPTWQSRNRMDKIIGAEIQDMPADWPEFVMNVEEGKQAEPNYSPAYTNTPLT